MPTAAERKTYLDGVADTGIAEREREEAEVEAARLAGEEAQRREAERLERQAVEERAAKDAYFAAVLNSERHWKRWLESETVVHEKAEAWRALNLTVANRLMPNSRTNRHSRYMSAGLRALPGANSRRYGEIGLANFFPQQGAPWLEAERRELGEKET